MKDIKKRIGHLFKRNKERINPKELVVFGCAGRGKMSSMIPSEIDEIYEEKQMDKLIKSFKELTNRPGAWDEDVVKLLNACGGDLELAVSLITDNEKDIPRENNEKIKPKVLGFNSHDCETRYQCICGYCFGSWDLFHQEKNTNGTEKYCPRCKKELIIN